MFRWILTDVGQKEGRELIDHLRNYQIVRREVDDGGAAPLGVLGASIGNLQWHSDSQCLLDYRTFPDKALNCNIIFIQPQGLICSTMSSESIHTSHECFAHAR